MNRFAVLALTLLLPALASAQAIRCTDPATGKVLYTDQPCKGGTLVVPKRSEAEQRADEAAAAAAQERSERRALQAQEQALQRQQQALAVDSARPPVSLADTPACRRAQQEASFRAASFSASEEEIRTARYNAALACGQQPPADIVVVQPVQRAWPLRPPPPLRPPQRFGMPPPPRPPAGAAPQRPPRGSGFQVGAELQGPVPPR